MNGRRSFVGLLLFSLFIILSILVWIGYLQKIDYLMTSIFQSNIPGIFITPFSVLSIIGSFEISVLIVILMVIVLKNISKLGVLLLFGLTIFIEIVGKKVITQIAPPIELLKTNLHLGFPSGGVAGELYAYPSGHSGRTAFVSGFLLLMIWNSTINKNIKIILSIGIITFDFFMFASRVYLAEHWLTDVIGGLLLGFSLALFYPLLASELKKIKI